jgi:hypothetical protein
MYHNVTLKRPRLTMVCRGRTVRITYYERVSGLGYPACSQRAPYSVVMCVLSGCTMFLHVIP